MHVPKSVRCAVAGLLLMAAVFGASACGNGSSEGGESGTITDFSFLNGWWVIDQTLAEIDSEARRPLVDIPSARWECTVDGDTMTVQTLSFRYSGRLTAKGDGWMYEGSAEFPDDKGDVWTSTIEVQATMDGEDRFGGTLERSVDSDLHGHDYTAMWSIVGARSEP